MPATLSPPAERISTRLPPKRVGDVLVYRLSVDQFDDMLRLGLLGENDAVEYLDGILYRKMPTNPPHDATANETASVVISRSKPGWCPRVQSTLSVPDGRPEPDVAIVRGRQYDYAARHPTPDDVGLVIEVADSTLAFDRSTKLEVYARAGIADYWIINLAERQIEIYTLPDLTGPEPRYASRVIRTAGEQVALPAALGGASIDVAALLPPG